MCVVRATRLPPCEGRQEPSLWSSDALKDCGYDDVRFVLRRLTGAENCHLVGPRFVVEVTIAKVQADIHSLPPPILAKCCRLSCKVCIGQAYRPFGLVRA